MEPEATVLLERYRSVREGSLAMCAPLQPEDYQVQPMAEVSPPKWNLGHTSWFFWQFILRPRKLGVPEDEAYRTFLNSYYQRAGMRVGRAARGLVTRPTVEEVYRYRRSIDDRMEALIASTPEEDFAPLAFLVTVGINHEQQHQELFYTEIKNIYFANPPQLRPTYRKAPPAALQAEPSRTERFIDFPEGLYPFGNVEGGWCWDNELNVHRAYLTDFALQDRLITNAEYLEFIEDGGYGSPLLWLSDGWARVEGHGWESPLYWEKCDGQWSVYTLSGTRPLEPAEPVCHVSFHEAFAFARWKAETDGRCRRVRLPTEREWEFAARQQAGDAGNFIESGRLHPSPAEGEGRLGQMLGDAWEWTTSHYEPYPGFVELPDNLSEYNGKFMNNQRVLRGGSCVTPRSHIRVSYRNFWAPETRFQFTGIRLAKDMG